MWMMVAFVLGEVAAYQKGMTVWVIAALLASAIFKTAEGRVKPEFQKGAGRTGIWNAPAAGRVLLLFFCFLAGWGRMRVEMCPDALERMVTQNGGTAEVMLSGTLDSVSEKNGWCTMILTEVEIGDEREENGKSRNRRQEKSQGEREADRVEDTRSNRKKKTTKKVKGVKKVLVSVKRELLLENIRLSEKAQAVNDGIEAGKAVQPGEDGDKDDFTVDKDVLPPCGSRIQLTGTAEFPEEARNPGQFSYRMYYRGLGIRNRVSADQIAVSEGKIPPLRRQTERFRNYAKGVFQEICDPADAGIFQAILLGDKSGLSEELRERFQDNGIAHILAVSGLHVSLIGMSVYGALRFLGVSYGWAGLGASALLTFYGFVTGFGASVFRAVFMVEVSCLAAYLGRSYDLLSALSLSLMLQAWQSPYLLFSAGLQLSYGAVAAIGLETERMRAAGKQKKEREEDENGLQRREKEKKEKHVWWNAVSETFRISAAIQLYTLPIQLYHYFTFPFWGIFLNLVVIPLLAYAAGSGLLALGIYSAAASASGSGILDGWKLAAAACTGPGHYIFQMYEWLCIQAERLPLHTITAGRPELWKMGVFYAVLAVRYVWSIEGGSAKVKETGRGISKERGLDQMSKVFTGAAVFFLLFQPVHGFQIWFLDVGQGDGVLLRTREAVILSDCGSSQNKKIGKNVLEPVLKSQGIRTLDWVLVSHADADHMNGIEWLLKEEADVQVRRLALPAAGRGQEAYEKIEAAASKRGTEVYYLHRGDAIRANRLSLTCIYPEAGEKPAGERNSHSLVFDVTYGEFSLLLTGDIGIEEEREILAMEEMEKGKQEKRQRETLLKAAHHGSNGSSSMEFLESLSPAFTVLSYGEGNTYGHPAPEAVKRLEKIGTEIWRTADSGAIHVWTDGKRMWIKGYKKED